MCEYEVLVSKYEMFEHYTLNTVYSKDTIHKISATVIASHQ